MRKSSKEKILRDLRIDTFEKYFDLTSNTAKIDISYDHFDDILDDHFGGPNAYKLDNEFLHNIYDYASLLPGKVNFEINLHLKDLDGYSPEKVADILNRNFSLLPYRDAIRNTKKIKLSITMLIVGIIFFVIEMLCKSFNWGDIAIEILDIAAWVFIWEAVTLFFLDYLGDKKEKRNFHKRLKKIYIIPEK